MLRGLREIGGMDAAIVVHGSTVATNAVLEGKARRRRLSPPPASRTFWEIGRQARPSLYDVRVGRPPPLVPTERRFGAPERVASDGSIIEPLTPEAAREIAARVRPRARRPSLLLSLSFLRPEHERMLRDALTEDGGPLVYVSHEVLPEYREYERTATTVINAFVAPRHGALSGPPLRSAPLRPAHRAVVGRLRDRERGDAGSHRDDFGRPRGGVAGAYRLAKDAGYERAICFDMGGTSTDVCLCDGGVPPHQRLVPSPDSPSARRP